MQINELSKLTTVKPETIRLYRNQGFLHPKKLSNGYYDYSMDDFASLIYIKKLREFDFSLKEIQQSQHEAQLDQFIDHFDHAENRLEEEIETLKQKIQYIHFEKDHVLASFQENRSDAFLQQSVDEKIDLYPPYINDAFYNDKHQFFDTTTCIFIPKKILNGEIEDKLIKTKVGIGTYRSLLNRKQLPTPANAIIIPNGLCINQTVYMHTLTSINIKDLAPMMTLSKQLNKPFISDTTGYLVGIHNKDGKTVYVMRIRACVEQNDIVSRDRL